MNARREKVENQIRKEELESIRYKSREMVFAHMPNMDAIHKIAYSEIDEKDEDSIPLSWNNLSEVLHFVSKYVRENTPGWFDEHVNLFREQTDGMFSIEYTEEEFAERLYEAIGFLGGNFRYRDSERFWNLRYFIQRYMTEQIQKR